MSKFVESHRLLSAREQQRANIKRVRKEMSNKLVELHLRKQRREARAAEKRRRTP